MPKKITESYNLVYDPTPPTPGSPRTFFVSSVRDVHSHPPGPAKIYATQVARSVWRCKDNDDNRRWLISTDSDGTAAKHGYDYKVYDASDRGKHKMWAKVASMTKFLSFFGLDHEPQEAKPALIEPTIVYGGTLARILDEQVTRFIEATAYRGPLDPIHGAKFTLRDYANAQHRTQKASNNTIFYVWEGNTMTVIGIGGHTRSNTDYEYTYTDGRKYSLSF